MFTAEIAALALPVFSLFSLGWLKGSNSTHKRIGLNKRDFYFIRKGILPEEAVEASLLGSEDSFTRLR